MEPLTAWREHLKDLPVPPPTKPDPFRIPRSARFFGDKICRVESAEEAEGMLQLAMERPISGAGLDFEYGYDRPSIVRRKHEWFDPSSIRPLLSSICLVEPAEDNSRVYTFAVDLRRPEVLVSFAKVLRLPVPFALHFAKGDLFCLWQLGIPEPDMLWDTWVHEKSKFMGRDHLRYRATSTASEGEQIAAKEELGVEETLRFGLIATCQRYGIDTPFAAEKGELQRSFLTHPPDAPFSDRQIAYAVEDAVAVAHLYPVQVSEAARHGILHHLVSVENPWVKTVARMEWTGIFVDQEKAEQARSACATQLPILESRLGEMGINNAMSNPQLQEFFRSANLLSLFAGRDGASFDKKLLKKYAGRHPAIPLINEVRQIRKLQSDGILDSELVGVDGRMHPEHKQLGTHTGRQTSRDPNILGLPAVLRPLVVARPGYGIGEVDLCQVEVLFTAAVFEDSMLVELANSDDVYSGMAQRFYTEELTTEDRSLPGEEFKRRHPEKRAAMKTCTLAIIYGSSSAGLAAQLGVTKSRADQFVEQFLAMFPALALAKERGANCSAVRGYAAATSGLRRYRGRKGAATGWERRWLVNFPVQGSAAVAFKMAGNRLDRLYPAYGAKLLLPMHDAFVFEAPLPAIEEVATLTGRVMCQVVQELFPKLWPRVEINITSPECWSKDGDYESLDRWIRSTGAPRAFEVQEQV